uniref:Outer membrane lipoprotein-sorting protein n=1 Tax=Solibacter usitatus (strain Ellin6076) TaxID=234267 RepID=Q01PK7_SOLUE
MKVRVFLWSIILSLSMVAETPADPSDAIVENYCTASAAQERVLKGASMEVEMDASLPKLQKHGRLHALRRISPLGLIRYDQARFEGDNIVNKEIISRYLTAEVETQKQQSPDVAVTPRNYKFKYKGLKRFEDRDVHVFEVSPRKKREDLFKGEIWIDSRTYLKVQESGYLVKSPSIFLKKVAFIRKYEIRDGIAVPLKVLSVADVRFVGKAELTIDFTNFSIDPEKRAAAWDGGQ